MTDHHGLNVPTLIAQTVNVSVLAGILYYFSAAKVRDYFRSKRAEFLDVAERAQAAQKRAQMEHDALEAKLQKLRLDRDAAVMRAQAEAADLRRTMVAEAEALSKKILQEAQKAAQSEVEKARLVLRQEMLDQAMALTRAQLKKQVSVEDHARLQGQFLHNIEHVENGGPS